MTDTLQREARRNVELFTSANFATGHAPKMSHGKAKNPQGEEVDALLLTDVPVFRSGTFRDSMGFEHTWESIHMDQMVAHFDMLTGRKIVESFPVRKGHGSFLTDPMDGLIGWHTALRIKEMTNPSDGKDYIYLLADYEILDPDAIQKISSGLWRNRSAEVGSYVTNAEAEFWPVYMGVAYVDFSAVEGLNIYSKDQGLGKEFSLMFESNEEAPVAGTESTQGTPAQATVPAAVAPATPAVAPVAPVAPNTSVTQTAQHAAPQGTVSTFTVNGQPVSDFAAVQAHITQLETFSAETRVAGRKAFIKGLAEGAAPKISAVQIPQLEAFALDLSEDLWTKYAASWDAAPAQSITGLHAGSGHSSSASSEIAALDDQISIAEGIVGQHRSAGKTEKQIAEMASFKRLADLRAQRAKAQS